MTCNVTNNKKPRKISKAAKYLAINLQIDT